MTAILADRRILDLRSTQYQPSRTGSGEPTAETGASWKEATNDHGCRAEPLVGETGLREVGEVGPQPQVQIRHELF